MSALQTLLIGGQVLSRVGTTHGLTGQAMRVLVAVGVLTATGGKPTYQTLAQVLGHSDDLSALKTVQILARSGYVSKHEGRPVGVKLLPAGQHLLDIVERTERRAVADLKEIKLGRWKRQYIRSGKYAGRNARMKASKEAKQNPSV